MDKYGISSLNQLETYRLPQLNDICNALIEHLRKEIEIYEYQKDKYASVEKFTYVKIYDLKRAYDIINEYLPKDCRECPCHSSYENYRTQADYRSHHIILDKADEIGDENKELVLQRLEARLKYMKKQA